MSQITAQQRTGLEARAGEVRAQRRLGVPALVVEFSGSPKAGKTTNIEIIAHFFKRMGFKVWAPAEGAGKRTPYHLKRDLVAFNTWSLNYAISELLVAYHNVDAQDLIILDRGPFDSVAWMSLLEAEGKLSVEELNTIRKFALHPKWFGLIARVHLFTCDPNVSMQRELNSKLTEGKGTAMNTAMLSALNIQYQAIRKALADDRIREHDTTGMSGPLDTALPIAQDLLSLMEAQSHVAH